MENNQYLGDSVYIRFDGSDFTLYLDNGEGEHNQIVLEPQVLSNLLDYVHNVLNLEYHVKAKLLNGDK